MRRPCACEGEFDGDFQRDFKPEQASVYYPLQPGGGRPRRGFPYIIPGSALGRDGAVAPSNRITLGFIGIGKMATGHLGSFLGDSGVQVLGICDVEKGRRENQAKTG